MTACDVVVNPTGMELRERRSSLIVSLALGDLL